MFVFQRYVTSAELSYHQYPVVRTLMTLRSGGNKALRDPSLHRRLLSRAVASVELLLDDSASVYVWQCSLRIRPRPSVQLATPTCPGGRCTGQVATATLFPRFFVARVFTPARYLEGVSDIRATRIGLTLHCRRNRCSRLPRGPPGA